MPMLHLLTEYRDTSSHEWQRYNCPNCSDTKGRYCVRYDGKGWYYHCFNCHPNMLYHSLLKDSTPQETLDYVRKIQEQKTPEIWKPQEVSLPKDFQYYIPDRSWLDQYHLTPREYVQFQIGYSPAYHRIILPSYVGGELLCWQGRYIGMDKKPKYITEGKKDSLNLFIRDDAPNKDTVVLVEDIISAIKVGRVLDAIGILGSYVSPKS